MLNTGMHYGFPRIPVRCRLFPARRKLSGSTGGREGAPQLLPWSAREELDVKGSM